MPHLTVVTEAGPRRIAFSPGASLRDLLDATSFRVRSGCRGNGLCGLCLVRVEAGGVNPPTANEAAMLTGDQLAGGERLACQVIPRDDVRIRILNAAASSTWRGLPAQAAPPQAPPDMRRASTRSFGLAVDLGTTHISLALWDLQQGVRVAGRVGLNPQGQYGADVVTRLIAAGESADHARRLAELALGAIREGLLDICTRCGVDVRQVVHVAVVGNTPMLAILTGSAPESLLRPEAWTREFPCPVGDPRAWADGLGIHPDATVEVISPLAGFVGSDLLAGVLAAGLTDAPGGLLVDFGTNSEIALWDGAKLWATSAAGGPAFEGCGIPCGMPAEPGAIDRVTLKQTPGSPAGADWPDFDYRVIEDGQAKGICGSGLVDLIACLLATGRLSRVGKFTGPQGTPGFAPASANPAVRLDVKGVDMFQRAKAAIGAGICALLARARMSVEQLQRVCVCGAFGQYMDVANAQAIGLLPATPPQRVQLCGNAALGGCELLLLSPRKQADLAVLRRDAMIVNLAQAPDFDALFLECLYLQPLETEAT